MKRRNTQLVVLAALLLGFSVAVARADIVPKAIHPLDARDVEVQVLPSRGDSPAIVEVRARAVFSNECLAPRETLRAQRTGKETLAYTFYAEPAEDRLCTARYLPVERVFLIDRFELEAGRKLPEISVNGALARVMSSGTN